MYKDAKFVPPADHGGRPARWRSTGRCGCRTSATPGTAWTSRTTPTLDIGEYYKRYAETLLGVDDSVGRVLDELKQRGAARFHAGHLHGRQRLRVRRARPDRQAHGLRGIDARAAAGALPGAVRRRPHGEAGGREPRHHADRARRLRARRSRAGWTGEACCRCSQGKPAEWRKELLYEYYWERNFPQTPTMHALRGDRYKFIRYHGIWDIDELYDLQEDPLESNNLIFSREHQPVIAEMRARLFDLLRETGGMNMPL